MRKKSGLKKLTITASLAGVVCLLPQCLLAAAQGPCVDCHTMHNSQDGDVVDPDGPNGALTNASGCIGCHTGTTDGGNIPYVHDTAVPTYTNSPSGASGTALAGGSFYWVVNTGDAMGHNVASLVAGDNSDAAIGYTPPGWNPDFNAHGQVATAGATTWNTNQLTCAGTYGCHGDHTVTSNFDAVSGSHHGDDSTINGETVASSYRFLLGIKGIEDGDWEFNATASAHNQYFGVDRTTDNQPTTGDAVATISYLCAECHGNYHSGAGDEGADVGLEASSAWLRHPTDYDMGNLADTEYADYNTDNSYSLMAPVASDQTVVSGVQAVVLNEGDDAIVMCLSCHRAHGSEHADALRWDYGTCQATTDNEECGCFVCHTTKDAG